MALTLKLTAQTVADMSNKERTALISILGSCASTAGSKTLIDAYDLMRQRDAYRFATKFSALLPLSEAQSDYLLDNHPRSRVLKGNIASFQTDYPIEKRNERFGEWWKLLGPRLRSSHCSYSGYVWALGEFMERLRHPEYSKMPFHQVPHYLSGWGTNNLRTLSATQLRSRISLADLDQDIVMDIGKAIQQNVDNNNQTWASWSTRIFASAVAETGDLTPISSWITTESLGVILKDVIVTMARLEGQNE